jgi:hypothetical protein
MDDQQPGCQQSGEESVEMQRAGVGVVQQIDQCESSRDNAAQESAPVCVMEAVALFKAVVGALAVRNWGRIENARVEEAVGRVDHPYRDEHRSGLNPGQPQANTAREEERPHCGDAGGIER